VTARQTRQPAAGPAPSTHGRELEPALTSEQDGVQTISDQRLRLVQAAIARVAANGTTAPDASIVVPVDARGDLTTVLTLIEDLARYEGPHSLEFVLVVNNYPPERPPDQIARYSELGFRVVAVPDAWVPGQVVSFSARVPGARAARSEYLVHFDADCRVPNPTQLVDWYVTQLATGAHAAYTRVAYHELRRSLSVRARIAAHHGARWIKRCLLGVPTLRGSNYAIRRTSLLELYDEGFLSDDFNVGPAVERRGLTIRYSGARELTVLTSGRRFNGGWRKLGRYLVYRLVYNVRALRVRPGITNPYHQKRLR
jgi:Glycosyltransferase like family 2